MSAGPAETIQAQSGRRRRQATVADILDATRRLINAGTLVANLSVEGMCNEAGIARATFYLHFKDKQALIARLAEDEVAWREQIGAEVLADLHLERSTLDAIMLNIVSRWCFAFTREQPGDPHPSHVGEADGAKRSSEPHSARPAGANPPRWGGRRLRRS